MNTDKIYNTLLPIFNSNNLLDFHRIILPSFLADDQMIAFGTLSKFSDLKEDAKVMELADQYWYGLHQVITSEKFKTLLKKAYPLYEKYSIKNDTIGKIQAIFRGGLKPYDFAPSVGNEEAAIFLIAQIANYIVHEFFEVTLIGSVSGKRKKKDLILCKLLL